MQAARGISVVFTRFPAAVRARILRPRSSLPLLAYTVLFLCIVSPGGSPATAASLQRSSAFWGVPVCPPQGCPPPLVFDFEDDLGGWELHGSAQRVQTQVLDGDWAVLGDGLTGGGAWISREVDLTAVARISVEQFYAGKADETTDFLSMTVWPIDGPAIGFSTNLVGGDPTANPGMRTWSAFLPRAGLYGIAIYWGQFEIDPPPPPPDRFLGFIDNITFHLIPEPSHLGLLGLLGVLGLRWFARTPRW